MMYITWMKLTKTKIVEKRNRLGYLIQLGALYSAQTSILLTREASTSSWESGLGRGTGLQLLIMSLAKASAIT